MARNFEAKAVAMPTDLDGPPGNPAPWWQRLDDIKLTPQIALLFFLALVLLSGLAAGVGFVAHHGRMSVSRTR